MENFDRTCPSATATSRKYSRQQLDELLVHAISCPGCLQQACLQMKNHWRHKDQKCQRNENGRCLICKRLSTLWRTHEKHCQSGRHNVAKCTLAQIQLKLLEIQLQEQELFRRNQQMQAELQNAKMKKRLQERFNIKY